MAKKTSVIDKIGMMVYDKPDISKKVTSIKKAIDEVNKIINEKK